MNPIYAKKSNGEQVIILAFVPRGLPEGGWAIPGACQEVLAVYAHANGKLDAESVNNFVIDEQYRRV